jgi:hypothetical protein
MVLHGREEVVVRMAENGHRRPGKKNSLNLSEFFWSRCFRQAGGRWVVVVTPGGGVVVELVVELVVLLVVVVVVVVWVAEAPETVVSVPQATSRRQVALRRTPALERETSFT